MSNNPNPNDYPSYTQYQPNEWPARKRKKKKKDGGRMWLGLGCLGLSAVVISLLVASLVFWLADNPEATATPLVQIEPSATPTLTLAPSLTLTFTPTPTFTPQGLFLTTSPVVPDEIPTLAPQLTPVPLDNRLIDIIWLRNSQQIVVASPQNVWLVDIAEEASSQKLNTAPNSIRDIALSRDEQWLAVAYETGYLELIGMETLLNTEEVLTGQAIYAIDFSPTDDILATALGDGTIAFWSVPDLVEETQFDGKLTNFSLAYRADGRQLAVGGINSQVDLWDIASEEKSISLNADHVGWVIALDYAPNGQWVASSGEGGAIFVTASTSGDRLYTLPAQANVLQFSPDSTRLASGGEDGLVRIWDFAEGEQFAEFDHQAPITSLAFRADGAWVAVGILDERLAIWEISSGDLVYEWVVE